MKLRVGLMGISFLRTDPLATIIAQADKKRDAKEFKDAAILYAKALSIDQNNAPILVQCGHMMKESGDLFGAESMYSRAKQLMPLDPDLALQLGHLYKISGRFAEAEVCYREAISLSPDWDDAAIEMARFYQIGWRSSIDTQTGDDRPDFIRSRLAKALIPREPESLRFDHVELIEVRHFGRGEITHWGNLRVVRGIEAVRGFCISRIPITEMRLAINGQIFSRQKGLKGTPLRYERSNERLAKYPFNVWCDFSHILPGKHDIDLQFVDAMGGIRVQREIVAVDYPRSESEYPNSDGIVDSIGTEESDIISTINSKPSMIRHANRALFEAEPSNILVNRSDQLGDMVCSIPGLRRLREIFPNAHIVGLVSPSNKEFVESLSVFDEMIVIDLIDDPWERKRIMTVANQERLRERLKPYQFDLAIDFSDSGVSRPLLRLAGARFNYGFRHGEFPWLSAGFEGVTRDPVNGLEIVPHTNKVMGMVEWLSIIQSSFAKIERREDLSRDLLEPFGLSLTDRFIVLHAGARLEFSRWPHYRKLASIILQSGVYKVVYFTDNAIEKESLGDDFLDTDRFIFIDSKLSFDEFDAFLSFCSAFVGNDSGPKHLASLRGANVVSIHMARNNWNEWGQENKGLIISRRVPCAGCSIHHDPEECGKDFACITSIRPEEVFAAINRVVSP